MPDRDWSATHDKNQACRNCGRMGGKLDRAHLVGRGRDRNRKVHEFAVVILCAGCHRHYDDHKLDLWPKLIAAELLAAADLAGGVGMAVRHLSGPLWRRPGAAPILDARIARLEKLIHERPPEGPDR